MDFDILQIPMDCPKTWALLQRGDTSGVFQLESQGMRNLLQQVKPTKFSDLVAVLALYRPAPLTIKGDDGLTMVERYIKVRNGELEPEYIHPDLEPILRETYGQLVYQEQMMEIAGVFAGFSLGKRDKLRKAMGKKLPEEMAKLENDFIQGCIANGYDEDLAKKLWSWLEKGAGYLFNKSHSASYALVSYQTAWLKANHPTKFMIATLSAELQDEEGGSKSKKLEKIAFYVEECRKMGIQVDPPLINKAFHDFTEIDGKIVFALNGIRGVGTKAIKQIIERRPYANFDDFLEKNTFKGSEVKKQTIVGLIKAGAFDETDPNRLSLIEKYQATRPRKEIENNPLITPEDWLDPQSTKFRWEKEVLGIYLTGHPLAKYSFKPYDSVPVGQKIVIGGEITKYKKIKTKKGQDMCFLTIFTPEGDREVTVFPLQFSQYKDLLDEGKLVLVEGKKEEKSIIAEKIRRV